MINDTLLKIIEKEALLFKSLMHGIPHWKTVERNGLYICQFTDADPKVVSYFSYFHDFKRENEYEDPEHGPSAAKFLKEHRDILALSDEQFNSLYHAVAGHTHGRKHINDTVSTCWDADRLDIGRCGFRPKSEFLFSKEAKRIADENDERVLINFGFVNEIF